MNELPALLTYLRDRKAILSERIKASDRKTALAEFLTADLEATERAIDDATLQTRVDLGGIQTDEHMVANRVVGRRSVSHQLPGGGQQIETHTPVRVASLSDLRSRGGVATLLADRAEAKFGDQLPSIDFSDEGIVFFPLGKPQPTIAETLDFTARVIERDK